MYAEAKSESCETCHWRCTSFVVCYYSYIMYLSSHSLSIHGMSHLHASIQAITTRYDIIYAWSWELPRCNWYNPFNSDTVVQFLYNCTKNFSSRIIKFEPLLDLEQFDTKLIGPGVGVDPPHMGPTLLGSFKTLLKCTEALLVFHPVRNC